MSNVSSGHNQVRHFYTGRIRAATIPHSSMMHDVPCTKIIIVADRPIVSQKSSIRLRASFNQAAPRQDLGAFRYCPRAPFVTRAQRHSVAKPAVCPRATCCGLISGSDVPDEVTARRLRLREGRRCQCAPRGGERTRRCRIRAVVLLYASWL